RGRLHRGFESHLFRHYPIANSQQIDLSVGTSFDVTATGPAPQCVGLALHSLMLVFGAKRGSGKWVNLDFIDFAIESFQWDAGRNGSLGLVASRRPASRFSSFSFLTADGTSRSPHSGITTVLMLQNSRVPSRPSSRPKPERLMP